MASIALRGGDVPLSPAAIRAVEALRDEPVASKWPDLRASAFEVDLRGRYQRVAAELRPLLTLVRQAGRPGYRFGAKAGRVPAAYRWSDEGRAVLDALGQKATEPAAPAPVQRVTVPALVDTVELKRIVLELPPERFQTARAAALRLKPVARKEALAVLEEIERATTNGQYACDYVSYDGGRYYARHNSIQNLAGDVARALLDVGGFDISGCHQRLLLWLLGDEAADLDVVKHCAENPKDWRRYIAETYGIAEKAPRDADEAVPNAKQLLLAMQYGAAEHGGTVAFHLMGQEPDLALKDLLAQMKTASSRLRRMFPEFRDIAKRAKQRQYRAEGRFVDRKTFFADVDRAWPALVVQHFERIVLDEMMRLIEVRGGQVLVPLHDGVFCRSDLTTEEVEAHLQATFGVHLPITAEK